jgi:geranyl-CoA carboxylase beta subunit
MRIQTELDLHGKDFEQNREELLKKIDEFRSIEKRVVEKSEESKEKIANSGKLSPRERINLLLDPVSPFLEIATLAGYKMHDDEDGTLAGGGLIAGIGFIEGMRCMVVVNNYTVKGGTISPAGLRKILRMQEIVMKNRLPLITLAESGGANLNYAPEVYIEGARAFANQARLSALGIPQVTVVHGNATAGGAYQPGLSDYIVLIENQSKMFLAGPPLVKAATGEDAKDEDLGGASMHARVSGTGEYLAKNDLEGISLARKIVSHLGPKNEAAQLPKAKEPFYSPEEILGIVPANTKKPYDVKEIIARIVDDSEFEEFKSEYENQTICGFARIYHQSCGFIGNNGPITSRGAGKAAEFMQLCDQAQIPVIFLHNTTGFMVGTDAEHSGIIKQGSKLIQAVTNSQIQKISLIVGGSYGAGNYAMCGRGIDPDFIFSWPNARTAVMGGEQAGKVLRIVSEEKMKKTGASVDEAKLNELEQKTAKKLDESSTALFSTAHLWDDGIIDPRDTRKVLAFVIATGIEARARQLNRNTFGVPRH